MPKLVLIDANHLMHRAYWAIQSNLSTADGIRTNAVFGVTSMLLTILKREQPEALIACWDDGSETFRHKQYDEYKAGRNETPDDFYDQIPFAKRCFEVFAIPVISNRKYEADDLIGTLAVNGANEGFEVVIISGDKDLFQMAGENIKIAIPNKGYSEPEYLDYEGVKKKMGVYPEQVPDYKGLTGDPSDNLKGVKGIGPKTASNLIEQYGSLDNIYENLGDIKGSVKDKLDSGRESAFFCRDMAVIVKDIETDLDLKKISDQKSNISDVEAFFADIEFYTLKSRLKKMVNEDSFAREYFSGNFSLPEAVNSSHETKDDLTRITEDQLPLLD
jgi:DNA polymerase I